MARRPRCSRISFTAFFSVMNASTTPTAAVWTDEHVFAKDARDKLRPGDARGLTSHDGVTCGGAVFVAGQGLGEFSSSRGTIRLRQADAGSNTPW